MYIFKTLCDSAKPWQYGYQDPATPIIRGIIHLHNNIIFYLIIILCLVCWLLFRAIFKFRAEKNKFSYKNFTHLTGLEVGWNSYGVPPHIKKKFRILYEEYEAIFNSIKKTGKLSGADLIRLKQLLVEMLKLQDKYKCMPPYAEAEIRDFLASITTKKKAK